MSKAFEDWLESLDLKPEERVRLNMAYISGRAYQREVDAKIAEKIHSECPVSESIWICSGNEEIAKAIREQKID